MNGTTDQKELLRKLIDRDERAASDFYENNFPRIYRLMYFSAATVVDAEELTRDTFLAFFESLERFKGECLLSTWLYSIAKNHLRNYYAKKKRRPVVSLDDALNDDIKSYLFDLEYSGDGPDVLATRKETVGLVHKVLAKLPENYREVLTHRYINGLDTSDTAEIMGKSEGNVRVLLFRAAKAFADEFRRIEAPPLIRNARGATHFMCGAE